MSNLQTKKIVFDEASHTYVDENKINYVSVTTLIHEFVPEFDKKFWSIYSAVRDSGYKLRPYPNARLIEVEGKMMTLDDILTSQYLKLKVTPEQLVKEWEDVTQRSLDRGNETHNYLEDEINDCLGKRETKIDVIVNTHLESEYNIKISSLEELEKSSMSIKYPTIYQVLVKLIKNGFTIYAERRIYHNVYLIAGTIDVLCVRGSEFLILDWKTNKDILRFKSGYYKKEWKIVDGVRRKVRTDVWVEKDTYMLDPLGHLYDCAGSHYTLQLSLYAFLCECWGLNLTKLLLCHVRRTDEKDYPPKFYEIPYRREDIITMLNSYIDNRLSKATNKLEIEMLKSAKVLNKIATFN